MNFLQSVCHTTLLRTFAQWRLFCAALRRSAGRACESCELSSRRNCAALPARLAGAETRGRAQVGSLFGVRAEEEHVSAPRRRRASSTGDDDQSDLSDDGDERVSAAGTYQVIVKARLLPPRSGCASERLHPPRSATP